MSVLHGKVIILLYITLTLYICIRFSDYRGASFTAKDINNHTPVMRAISSGHQSIVKMFLEAGCKVDTIVRQEKTLLEWAIENEYNALIKVSMHNPIAIS